MHGAKGSRQYPREQRTVAAAVTVAGIALVLTSAAMGQSLGDTSSARTKAQLVSRIESARQGVTDAETANAVLAAGNRAMATRILKQSSEGTVLAARIAAVPPSAGSTAIRGPGGCTTVTPKTGRMSDSQVQALVNALVQSDPLAVAINDIRLNSRSAIRSAGSQLLVGFQPVGFPLQLCAIYESADRARIERGWRRLDRLASAMNAQTRHSMRSMTLSAASDKITQIRFARAR